MSIANEVAELMERFQSLATEKAQAGVQDLAARAIVADELAEIIIWCLCCCQERNKDAGGKHLPGMRSHGSLDWICSVLRIAV
jgi:NTP pyrophosphatase (non-canonical NTP hydrolase)